MLVTLLYGKIEDLYDRYRAINWQGSGSMSRHEATALIDDSLYLAGELVEVIEQMETELQKNTL